MRTPPFVKHSLLALTFALSLFGCGQQTFDVLQSQHNTDAPGAINVPARVDILMVIDNTGSMLGKEAFVGQQIRNQFLGKLDAQNWDYRVAIVPTTPNGIPALSQMAVSRYSMGHPNYTAPYPNADLSIDPYLMPDWSIARTSAGFNANAPASGQSGAEPTMITVGDILNHSDWQTRFLRPTAKLVVIVVSNGDDTSEPATNPNVFPYLPPSTVKASLLNRITAVRPTARFDAVVNLNTNTPCLNGTFQPKRYTHASGALNGKTWPLCTPNGQFDTSFGRVLAGLAEDLQPIRLQKEQGYAVIERQPILNTIVVKKNGVILPSTSADRLCSTNATGNGWCYEGQGTAYEIVSPVFEREKTGYKIRLVGSARAIGNEQITVNYQEFGTNASF